MEKKYDMFISYSRMDYEKVRSFIDELEAYDFKIWYDISNIDYGDTFPDKIAEALDNSHSLLFICTPNSVKANYCKKEMGYARQNDMKIRAVLFDGTLPHRGWFGLLYQDVNCVNITKHEQKIKFYEELESVYQPAKAEERLRKIEEAKAEAKRKAIEEKRRRLQENIQKAQEEETKKLANKKWPFFLTTQIVYGIIKRNLLKSIFIVISAIVISALLYFSIANKGETKSIILHESVTQYNKNIGTFETKSWKVRVDMLNDSTFRYASWGNPTPYSEKPELILYNGIYDSEKCQYIFKNGSFTYIVDSNSPHPDTDSITIYKGTERQKQELIINTDKAYNSETK